MMKRLSLNSAIMVVLVIAAMAGCRITGHPTSETITANRNTLYFEVHGNGDQPLVLIHGWSNNLRFWDGQIEALSGTCRVVAVDLPGFGASINHRDDWTMASFGADVAAVIDHLKLKEAILVGFSMGGPVSIEAAKHAPGKIRGIVLVDTIQNPEASYPRDQVTTIANLYMDAVTYPDMMKVKPFFRTQKDKLGARFMAMVEDVPKAGWEASLVNCFSWLNTSAAASIKSIDLPILAINADQQPTEEAIFRKYCPTYHARIIEGVYHVVPWESPELFTRYLKESIADIRRLSPSS